VTVEAAAPLKGLGDAALLDVIEQGLALLSGRVLDSDVDDGALADSVERLHRIETRAGAEKLRRIAEADLRQTWRAEGARSMADLLTQRLKLTRGEARAQAETALELERLPETAAALRAGDIGLGQAQVAARAAKSARPDAREELDQLIAQDGGGLDRRQLREHVDAWTAEHDPEALAERERRMWAQRRLSIGADGPDGAVGGGFRLDPVGGATVMTALHAKARKTGPDDDRTHEQRMADAMVELAQQALDAGDLPQVAVQRPHVIMIVHPDGQARLDGVGPVSQPTAELVCCDAEVTEVTMTRNHEVLDAGRTRRQPTRRQRIAVIARDQVCVGCGGPVSRCQIHHVEWWTRDLGDTDEDNLCLVCWGCHFNIHHYGWQVVRDRGSGRFRLRPPDPSDRQASRHGRSRWRRAS